jgi:threonine dehydratase
VSEATTPRAGMAGSTMTNQLSAAAVRASLPTIPAELTGSPQYLHEGLSELTGHPVVVKVESLNPIRSFKGRGTWLAVRALAEAGTVSAERGLVALSSGNFGQGIAYAGRAHGIPVTTFMGTGSNPTKVARLRQLGSEIVQPTEDLDDCWPYARAYAEENDQHLVVDGKEPLIAVGAGTLAVELTEAIERGELPPLGAVYIPVGDGALISGIGAWLREASPSTQVIGIQSEAAPAVALSWRAGRVISTETSDTVADGIETRIPIPECLDLMAGNVDDMVLVTETAIREAQHDLSRALGVSAEAAAGASLAGLRAAPPREGAALVLVTGSNVPASDWELLGRERS